MKPRRVPPNNALQPMGRSLRSWPAAELGRLAAAREPILRGIYCPPTVLPMPAELDASVTVLRIMVPSSEG
jgi:hypothetical protein